MAFRVIGSVSATRVALRMVLWLGEKEKEALYLSVLNWRFDTFSMGMDSIMRLPARYYYVTSRLIQVVTDSDGYHVTY